MELEGRQGLSAPQLQPERQLQLVTPEGFLGEFYDRVETFLQQEKGAVVIARFDEQEVLQWDVVKNFHWGSDGRKYPHDPKYIRMLLEKGAILRSPSKVYGIAFGRRKLGPGDFREEHAFQVGSHFRTGENYQIDIMDLSHLVRKNTMDDKLAFFTASSLGKVLRLSKEGESHTWTVGEPIDPGLEKSLEIVREKLR